MSTFQERILAASGSSSSTADTDPELYRYRSASSEEYLESCNYRVWSTELPDRFLVWWMCPVGRDEAEQRSLERELRSDEESPLHIPLEIFMTAYSTSVTSASKGWRRFSPTTVRSGRKMLRPRWRRSWPAMPTTVRRRSPSPKDSFVFNSRFLASAIRTSSIALGLSKTFK